MDQDTRRNAALARRDKLKALIAELQNELWAVEREIRLFEYSPGLALTQSFFWSYVVPILKTAGDHGLTGAAIRRELEKRGMPVESGKFRVFLSRSRQRGWLEFASQASGHRRWRLTPQIETLRPEMQS
ncbi:MAG: hypothetical protein K8R18_00790 [Parvibaculum sp.]|uniref:hypothetical protein n=1 Tax=Parvibaculum sp. TaxID=2024848 RepID=UPI0025F8C388|nr:hypothetical protein [Parvibaculum sp.]MCE9648133.1 hypothetical protein [Parvibaculum sp.]